MPKLEKCAIQIFGANFQAAAFHQEVSLENSRVVRVKRELPICDHYAKAYRLGGVNRWECYSDNYQQSGGDNSCNDEEVFMISFLAKFADVLEKLKPYRSDTTEIWFFALYAVTERERPSGFFYSDAFFQKLDGFGCSFSSDVRVI